jgi:hypothetical protein
LDLGEKFDSISRQMRNNLEDIRNSMTHPGEKGRSLEEIFRQFLKKYFPGSNAAIQSNAFQILSLLKNIQIGTASIVNANWTLPQTISMGFLGLGNRIAASAPSDFVLVVVVPFQGISNVPTLPLR